MPIYSRGSEPHILFEAHQYSGTRASLHALLQPGEQVPCGLQRGEWLVRQLGTANVRLYPDKRFRKTFLETRVIADG